MTTHKGSYKEYIAFLPAVADAGPLAPALPPAPTAEAPIPPAADPSPEAAPPISLDPIPIAAPPKTTRPSGRWLSLAASLVGAACTGAVAAALLLPRQAPATADAEEIGALVASIAGLKVEIADVRRTIDSIGADARGQTERLAQRLDKAEKTSAESTARLARLEGGERRVATVVAPLPMAPPPIALPAAPAAAPMDITGSVPRAVPAPMAPPPGAKPQVLPDWIVREAGPGVARVEGRNAGVFEVVPGMRLPGLGRVEAIERRDGRAVVITQRGLIVSPR